MKPEDVDKMTLQQFCDFAVKKIVEQGQRCRSGSGCAYGVTLAYPGQPTLKMHCGIGWGLDEDDEELMGYGRGVYELVSAFSGSGRIPKLIEENLRVMCRLQNFHDSSERDDRSFAMRKIRENGIDTSGEHWKQWVEMGHTR